MPKRKYSKKRSGKRKASAKRPARKRRTTTRKSAYRASVPRYLELAHYKPKTKTVRFSWTKEWILQPKNLLIAGQTFRPSFMMQFRANSICNIGSIYYTTHTDVASNDAWDGNPDIQFTTANIAKDLCTQAPGYNRYYNDYTHFTVLGSTFDATALPYGGGNTEAADRYLPSVLTVVKHAKSSDILTPTSVFDPLMPADMSKITRMPYSKSATISLIDGTSSHGGKVGSTYSAKKFEGVTDVKDNRQLKGLLGKSANANQGTEILPANPSESSYFSLVYGSRLDGREQHASIDTTAKIVPVTLRIRMSYIVKLTEPTQTNERQII